MLAISRSGKREYVLTNWEVRDLTLGQEDLEVMDEIFPAAKRKVPLGIV